MNFPQQTILMILFGAVLAGFACAAVALRLAALLQQSGYRARRFFKWYFSKGNIQRKRLSLLSLSLVLLTALFDLCFSFLGHFIACLLSAAPFFGLIILYLWSEKRYALKVRPKRSARFVRLALAHYILLTALCAGLGFGLGAAAIAVGSEWFSLFAYVPFALLPMALPFTLVCASGLMAVYEIPHNRRFIGRAKRALAKSRCVKVGITGSFGKTSVKHYAEQLLSAKYTVIATPQSYNTPMGIAKTVKERGADCDVFLAEMGARYTGDIRTLCDLVRPDYGVIVGICAQHVETFGSLAAIAKEKGVLAQRAKKCILGASAAECAAENSLLEGREFAVGNISLTAEGTSFDLTADGERIRFETKLLGRHAAEDVALAAALCRELGMSMEEIAAGAKELTPVPHRLEKIEKNGLTILDDAYNSNIEGAKNALETLRLMPGRQVVVTPGLVELGEIEEKTNAELGAALVGLDVILVGETLVLPVKRGYLEAGGEAERLRIVPTLRAAQEILSSDLRAGDSVLFLNDLPDLY